MHWAFADEVLPHIPTTGSLFFITISPPEGAELTALSRCVLRTFDDWDCDFFAAEDWGKQSDHAHLHLVVHLREPEAIFEMLGPHLRAYKVNPETFNLEQLWGWSSFVRGKGGDQLRKDLATLSAYSTQPPKGNRRRLAQVHTRARGIFYEAWKRLLRDSPPMTSIRGCAACGLPIPTGARSTRVFCDNKCRQRNDRRGRKERRIWRVTLPASYVRALRALLGGLPGRAARSSAGRRSADTPTSSASATATRTTTES